MTQTHWDDQPRFLNSATQVASLYLQDVGAIQVLMLRSEGEVVFYLTVGNLFGSQTLECENALAVLSAMDWLSRRTKKTPPGLPPPGTKLVPNHEVNPAQRSTP